MKQKHLIYIVIGVVVSWIVIPTAAILIYGKPDSSGTFGDTFGVINALFSSLAFALLIYTAWMQKEELSLQRDELKMTREELAKSAEAQEKLVELTAEQSRIQLLARRNQIRPELIGPTNRYPKRVINDFADIIALKVGANPLKIDQVVLYGEGTVKLKVDVLGYGTVKYLKPDSIVEVCIYREDGIKFILEDFDCVISFFDEDNYKYVQTLTYKGDKHFLPDPVLDTF